jgi:hypothetical protein
MTEHPSWDDLNDLADAALAGDARTRVEEHLRGCATCAATFARLEDLRRLGAALPAEITPPNEAWDVVRDRIAARRGLRLTTTSDGGSRDEAPRDATSRERQRVPFTTRWLVAAAVVLVAASSAVTAVLVRRPAVSATVAAESASVGMARLASLPADVRATERDYLATAEALEATLAEERAQLSPETVAVVERSLRVIDSAIVEARAALLRDPASADLRDLWSRSHPQKLDLQRRATEVVRKS